MTVTITPVNVGSALNASDGDNGRVAFQAVNANEANLKASVEALEGRFWTIRNTTLDPLVIGARYNADNHSGITFTTPAAFAVSATALSDIWVMNSDDAGDVTLTPASGDAFFVNGATLGTDTTYALTPGSLAILCPRTTDTDWDLLVLSSNSIASITGTKAEFDAACTDGNFVFDGDAFGTLVCDEIDGDSTSGTLSLNSDASDGSNLILYGSAHATQANDLEFVANSGVELHYDDSTSTFDFQTNILVTAAELQTLAIQCDAGIREGSTDGYMYVSGGSNSANGAVLWLYGGSHATLANDWKLKSGSTDQIHYDDSASQVNFQANDLATTGNLAAANATLDFVFINEASAAAADVAGDGQFWVKDDAPNTPQFTDDAGTDFNLLFWERTVALGDETTAITTGTAKTTFRMPCAVTLTEVRASLTTASSSGIPTFDINEGGTTILSTKLTIDANETTSTTAATAAVISDAALADDAEITFDVDVEGTGAAGAKITLIGYRAS